MVSPPSSEGRVRASTRPVEGLTARWSARQVSVAVSPLTPRASAVRHREPSPTLERSSGTSVAVDEHHRHRSLGTPVDRGSCGGVLEPHLDAGAPTSSGRTGLGHRVVRSVRHGGEDGSTPFELDVLVDREPGVSVGSAAAWPALRKPGLAASTRPEHRSERGSRSRRPETAVSDDVLEGPHPEVARVGHRLLLLSVQVQHGAACGRLVVGVRPRPGAPW